MLDRHVPDRKHPHAQHERGETLAGKLHAR
jgi:hypothetical protein